MVCDHPTYPTQPGVRPIAIKTTQKLRKANGGVSGPSFGGGGGFGTPSGRVGTGVFGGGIGGGDRRDIGSKTTIITAPRFPRPQFPMGRAFPTVQRPRIGIPPLVPTLTPPPPINILNPTVGRPKFPQPTVEPWFPSTTTGAPPMASLDLGQLALDLGTSYFQQKFARPASYPFSGGFNGGGAITATPALDIPFVDVISEAPTKGMVWNPAANCGAGKWQRKSRRRRKRLATSSDIKDLSSLKGVLGGGKAFEVWIATHS